MVLESCEWGLTPQQLEVDRLIAIIDPHNQPSQRVAENLGLVVARTSDNHGRWSSKRLIYAASL